MEKHPLSDESNTWETVVEECEALADDYRERDWRVVVALPGDVAPVPGTGDDVVDHVGLDIVVGDDVYSEVESAVEGTAFDEYESFRAVTNGLVYLALIVRATEDEVAVCLPLYYRLAETDRMFSLLADGATMRTKVHPLDPDKGVEFVHEDPEPLLPPDWDAEV
ncbi:hypothetical protein E6P09_06055 [Haloferax mediterranei ATCC 33500]|uniref:Uncharacterized protein n=1 Tax=Haloferax mediterranei (strain ATCC 33500 / DSM 1411 / JCM 8866 / NBRC 14739 / NCIMB 2177 / R-4) TaxID=523841 RepID=I3R268_HALMT|nr:hypothetical protein [Haloferax mediterranei]AFK18328.1 hypothetical protein HFX_0603 [Haloferax mediterranei ATCC 33500]AHZ22275.1 hypothetical protein BM92_06245 [Haloferax mediterranei ATCC 33500]EMA02402.1 hypothetical protein C439_07465 [Haloferax mediterranei ATCC 33500]MDX5988416.1 hypothetical protein [Haloferax mediterranei ATCC 33500]QCQ74840.1 hypothetical protein E6P09_06055 [Haloferax mediterranei ATCC 33500]